MRVVAVSLLVVVGATGCPAPSGADAGRDAGPRSTEGMVQGDFISRFVLPDGGIDVIVSDLSTRTVIVSVEADGGYAETRLAGSADGTFLLPVDAGRYLLELGGIYLSTTSRVLHLGPNQLGRKDAFIVNPNEGLQLSATNLAPWTENDELELASWGAGLGYFSSASGNVLRGHLPDAGDQSLSGLVIDLEGSRVIQASLGDDAYLLQLSAVQLDAGLKWKSASRAVSPSIELAYNALTPLNVDFTTLMQQPVRVRIDTAAFEAFANDVGAHAKAFESRYLLDVHFGAFGPNTITSGAPDLAILTVPPDAGHVDLSLTWGNPFSPQYTPFVTMGTEFEALYQAPFSDGGLALARSEVAVISRILSLEDAQAEEVGVALSPVRDVRIDDQPIGEGFPTVGRTPLVSWSAPAVGSVTRVDVQAIVLEATSSGTRRRVGSVLRVVGASSIRLPDGFLEPGQVEYLRVIGIAQPPSWDATAPLRDVGPPVANAATMTRAFRVAPLP